MAGSRIRRRSRSSGPGPSCSRLPVEGWPEVIGEPTIADAVLDRIVHNAYRIELKGESQRKRNKPPPLDGGDDGNRAPA